MGLKNFLLTKALDKIKDKLVNPEIAGIGVIREISWIDDKLFLIVTLCGMEQQPIEITAEQITITRDGSSVAVGKYQASMAFVETALNRYAVRTFPVPEGMARIALAGLAKTL